MLEGSSLMQIARPRHHREAAGAGQRRSRRFAPLDRRSHVAFARPILPRPVLREKRAELATAREAGAGEGDSDHQVLATPVHRVRKITLTLTLSRSTGRGDQGVASAMCFATEPAVTFPAGVVTFRLRSVGRIAGRPARWAVRGPGPPLQPEESACDTVRWRCWPRWRGSARPAFARE